MFSTNNLVNAGIRNLGGGFIERLMKNCLNLPVKEIHVLATFLNVTIHGDFTYMQTTSSTLHCLDCVNSRFKNKNITLFSGLL